MILFDGYCMMLITSNFELIFWYWNWILSICIEEYLFTLDSYISTMAPFHFHRHLDFFQLVRNEDERELAKRFDMVSHNILLGV